MPLGKGGSQGQRLCLHTQSQELPRSPQGHQTPGCTTTYEGGSTYLYALGDRPGVQETDHTANFGENRVREGTYHLIFLKCLISFIPGGRIPAGRRGLLG